MSNWTKRFSQHPVHAALDALLATISSAREAAEQHKQPEPALEATTRLQHAAGFARSRLQEADRSLWVQSDLDALQSGLQGVKTEIDAFLSNANTGHLANANNTFDGLLPRLVAIPQVATLAEAKGAAELLQRMGADTKTLIESLRKQVEQAATQATNVATELKNLKAALASEKTRLDQLVNQHQQQFSDQQNARQTKFDQAEQKRQSRFDTTHAEWEQQHEKHTEAVEQQTSTLVKSIEEQLTSAQRIVGLIAGTGMAGGYKRDADAERKSYASWNLVAIGSFIALVGFAILIFYLTTKQPGLEWPQLLGRLLTVGAFLLMGAYAAQIAKGHRESERRHRHKQLALESLDAFLRDLKEEDQKAVKHKLADAFFVSPEAPASPEETGAQLPAKPLIEVMNVVAKMVK